MNTLVFFAVKEEARSFSPPAGCSVFFTGMGSTPARRIAEDVLASHKPARVFTCGFAGGLNPALPIGALIFDTEDERVAEILTGLNARRGIIHCQDRVATSREEKARLRDQTRADAVEMESGIIRQTCLERRVPATTLRVISDAANEDLPLDFNGMMTASGKLRFSAFLGQMVLRPDRWPALMRLQQKTSAAARVLGGTLEELLRRLG